MAARSQPGAEGQPGPRPERRRAAGVVESARAGPARPGFANDAVPRGVGLAAEPGLAANGAPHAGRTAHPPALSVGTRWPAGRSTSASGWHLPHLRRRGPDRAARLASRPGGELLT